MILAYYTPKNIIVEVIKGITTGNRTKALVRALAGEPFTRYTHGGPMDTDSAIVSPDLLTGLTVVSDDDDYTKLQQARQARNRANPKHQGEYQRHPVTLDNEQEPAGAFVKSRGYYSTRSLGGINND